MPTKARRSEGIDRAMPTEISGKEISLKRCGEKEERKWQSKQGENPWRRACFR